MHNFYGNSTSLVQGVSHRALRRVALSYVELRSATYRLRRACAALRSAYASLRNNTPMDAKGYARWTPRKLNMFIFSRTFGVEHWTQKVRSLYASRRNTTLLYDLRRVAYVYVDDLALGSVLLCRHGVK